MEKCKDVAKKMKRRNGRKLRCRYPKKTDRNSMQPGEQERMFAKLIESCKNSSKTLRIKETCKKRREVARKG